MLYFSESFKPHYEACSNPPIDSPMLYLSWTTLVYQFAELGRLEGFRSRKELKSNWNVEPTPHANREAHAWALISTVMKNSHLYPFSVLFILTFKLHSFAKKFSCIAWSRMHGFILLSAELLKGTCAGDSLILSSNRSRLWFATISC